MRKKYVILFSILAILILSIGLLFMRKNNILLKNNSIKIVDATYNCFSSLEKFYEDDEYIYYFPCIKSDSVYVKFSNGNKMVVDALADKKVTISELIHAGLEVKKEKK